MCGYRHTALWDEGRSRPFELHWFFGGKASFAEVHQRGLNAFLGCFRRRASSGESSHISPTSRGKPPVQCTEPLDGLFIACFVILPRTGTCSLHGSPASVAVHLSSRWRLKRGSLLGISYKCALLCKGWKRRSSGCGQS